MSGYIFTDRLRKTLQLAREEVAQYRRPAVTPPDILAGILREGEGVAAAILENHGVALPELLENLRAAMAESPPHPSAATDVPYTTSAKKCLELAMSEARELGYPLIGTELLLLGVIRQGDSRVVRTLANHGVTLKSARREILDLYPPSEAQRVLEEPLPTQEHDWPSVETLRRSISPSASRAGEIALVVDLDSVPPVVIAEVLAAFDALHRSWGGGGLVIRSETVGATTSRRVPA